ncbi:protein transport protein Sec24-like [Musa troglodytarum]|uniref:Protein transport protein Sec24-like n=1 Tax=Musa troglodytarum TaxID=320322 RepID=A0A9E7HTY2_9LILI|nr:protein transport protein Sec24-like [Musa troglodytarum]
MAQIEQGGFPSTTHDFRYDATDVALKGGVATVCTGPPFVNIQQGKEQANFPGRPTSPFLAAPQSSTPFRSPGPVGGIEASGPSRATTPFVSSGPMTGLGASGSPQNTSPFLSSGPAIGTQPSSYRAPPPFMRISSSSHASSSSYWSATHASNWNFSSSVPNSGGANGSSSSKFIPVAIKKQYATVIRVCIFCTQNTTSAIVVDVIPMFPKGLMFPHFNQIHRPPIGGVQGLVEEFQSLTVGSVPGALDPGVDTKSLPRPLNGDEEPTKILEVYPFNCHPRFMRLTTHAIPNSQSLLSRWHLPLGAVVHPLAEAPDGEEVPIVNFGPAGIIRCRRCRTYVNPYVTFTDAGRKWRCNLCSLLNDVILILQFPVYTSICFTLILHEMITGLSRK